MRKTACLTGLVMLLCAAVCFFFSWQAGCAVLAAGILVLLVYFLDSRKRYAAIQQTAQQIDRLLHGDDAMDWSLYEEGELSILHSELRKLVLRLREQTELLSKEKTALADSLADISHQLRTPLTAIHLNTASLQAPVCKRRYWRTTSGWRFVCRRKTSWSASTGWSLRS